MDVVDEGRVRGGQNVFTYGHHSDTDAILSGEHTVKEIGSPNDLGA